MTRSLRLSIPLLAALGLVLGSPSSAFTEDDFPPPDVGSENVDGKTPPSKTPPSKTPPATEAAPAKKAAWSAPAVTPGAGSELGSLPPPRVVRRRGSLPARTPAPNRGTRAPRGRSPAAPIRDVPAVRAAPYPRAPARPAPPRDIPPRDVTPAGNAARAPTTQTPAQPAVASNRVGRTGLAGSRVFGITKQHNMPLKRVPGEPQELALQFDIDYEVIGQAGRDVHVAMWFARVDNNTLVTSSLPAYGDARGNATLQTRSARIGTGANARYKASLLIPYRAFPIAAGESSYNVEARVQILRTESNDRVTVLCSGTTTFRVYGFDENKASADDPASSATPSSATPSSAAPSSAAPSSATPSSAAPGERGTAVANEDGTISDGR